MAISYAKYFTTPTQSVTDEPVSNEVSSNDLPGENSVDFSRYGVMENGNTVGFTKLNVLMDADGVGADDQRRYDVQQKWLANFDAKWGNSQDPVEQEKYQKTRENILARSLKENGVFNQIGQAWDRNKDAVAGQIEGVYDGGVSRLSQSDEELLQQADPELYKKVQAYGGLNRVRGTLMTEDDLSGVGSMMAFGDTPLDMNFAKEVQQKIDNLRAKDVMNRANQEAVTVIGEDGKEHKVSRMQADKIVNSRPSQIVGDEEAGKRFEDNPLSMFYDANVARHALGLSVGSTVRNLPTTISGAALSVVNPYLGMAVMNTGNLTDQEYSAVQDAIDKGFKAKYGGHYDPAKISAQEWLEMTNDLADKGDIAKASAEGYTTGALMTIAGTATGGVVEKFGISKIAKMSPKTLAGKIAKWGGLGSLSLSDEGIQEVAETMVENARKGDPIDKGLSQAFLLGMFSVENISHKGASGVGHLIRKAKEKAQANDTQWADETTTTEETPSQDVSGGSTQTGDQPAPQADTQSQTQADVELDRASDLISNIERNANGEYVNESGENIALLDPQGAIQQQFGQFNAELDQIMTSKGFDPTDPQSRRAFMDMLNSRTGNVNVIAGTDAIIEEAKPLYDKLRAGTLTEAEAARLGELEQQYQEETTQEIDGLTVNRNLQVDVANQPQGNVNEDRDTNRDGTENANGSSIEQGTNESNGSGTQSSSEVGDTVSPVETETTTTGDSQSDTGAATDLTGEPDNNSQSSSSVGANGRTGNTVGQGLEQGTLGENRGEQTGEPTETTQRGSENSGVQQRTQSDSVGETLESKRAYVTRNGGEATLRSRVEEINAQYPQSRNVATYADLPPDILKEYTNALEALSALRHTPSEAKALIADVKRESPKPYFLREEKTIEDQVRDGDFLSGVNKSQVQNHSLNGRGLFLSNSQTINDTYGDGTLVKPVLKAGVKINPLVVDGNLLNWDSLPQVKLGDSTQKINDLLYGSGASKNLTERGKRSTDSLLGYILANNVTDRNGNPYNAVMIKGYIDAGGNGKRSNRQKVENIQDGLLADTLMLSPDIISHWVETPANNRAVRTKDVSVTYKELQDVIPLRKPLRKPNQKISLNFSNGILTGNTTLDEETGVNAKRTHKTANTRHEPRQERESSVSNERATDNSPSYTATQSKNATQRSATKSERQDDSRMPLPIKQENVKKRAMDNAIAIAKEQANPFIAKMNGDFKADQKTARELYLEHKGDAAKEGQIKAAYLGKHTKAKWDVIERGYHIFNDKNPNHKELAKQWRHKPYGVDFENNPVYRNEKEIYKDLQEGNTTASQITLTLSEEPQTAASAVERAVNNFFKKDDNRKVENNMRKAVEDYANEHNYREEDGSVIQGTDENLAWAANNDHFLEWVGSKLRPFFEKLNKVIAAVVAVVAVGAMAVPTDAMAQQGFSTYTQGETVKGVSQDASNTINWVMQHKDHNGKNFVVADKDQGKIHIVSPDGKVLDTQNALFGKGRGNDNSDMNTPSGRMQLKKETKLNKTEKGIYGDSVLEFVQPETKASVKQKGGGLLAMHRVVNKPEREAALNSATASDNYLSHGCVNIPTAFYNTAVDSLDGAMVYVLDHKEPKQAKQATKEVKQTTTPSGLTYSKSPLTQSPSGLKMQRSGLSVQTPSKLSIADVNYDKYGLSKSEVKKTLKKVLGDLSDRVTLISREDFDAHNADYAYINRNGVEGFFDAETGSVFLVADQIKKGNGLTAPERAAWVAWHELTHAGLDTKYGNDLKQILVNVKDDPFVSQLAEAIQLKRASRNDSPAHVSDLGAVEEAIAEINAAVRTGKLGALTERYGLVIPEAYHDFAKEVSTNFLQKLRNLFNKLLGRKAVVSNNQVIELLRSLPQEVEAYAPVASRAITERVLSQLNNPESAYRQAKYSIGETVAETAGKAANYILSNTLYKNRQLLNTAGANPNAVGVGKRQDEVLDQSLNPMEKFIEGMYDSQTAAIKHLGGLKTRYGQMLKTATNRTSQVKTMFQKDLFHLLKNMENVAKKAYARGDRVAIQNDLQTITTALGSLTGINSKMMANYERILFDPDYGLETELQALGVDLETGQANQVMSPWQAKQIGEMWQRYQELKAIHEKSTKSINRLMDEKFARKGEDPKRMREDLRMYNGQTTAEAYNRITKGVKAGLLDVSVKGKPWLDYIKDVGFTEDKGFADESKRYDIDEKDIELNGHLAPLIDEYTSFAQSIYNYKEQHLGKALVGESFDNRFEVPTMGKVESMKFGVDNDGNFRVKKDKKVEDIVSLEDATEYQSKRLGRALLGGNVISNLNTLIDLTAQQTQYQPLFQALYDQRNDKDGVAVKVFNIADPEYNLMKGAILYVDILGRNGKPTGKKKYVKVALDNDEATAALFGDNVQEMDITGMNLVRTMNKIVTMSLTGNPAFSLWNALRGLWEKLDQVASQFGGKDNAYFMEQIQNSNTATAQLVKSNNAIVSFLRKPALVGVALTKIARNFFPYTQAASAMALYMIDKKGKYNHGNMLVGKKAKMMFNRLMQAYQQGTISTRAESYRLTPEQLQAMHSSYRGVLGNTFGTVFKSLPRKGVMMLDSLQEYAQFLTTTGELVSTLAIQDVLTDAGMDIDRANEANLHFMNFNDKGANIVSVYLRAALPFANATAQGNRSTMRSITSKGVSLILYGAVSSYLLQELSNVLQDLMPCDKDVSDNAFENRNDAELQRDIPFRLGCSGEFRLPIGYGVGAISHSIGVGLYQLANNNWSGEQALKFASHVAAENLLPLPMIPDSKSSPVSIAVKSIVPYQLRVFMNANSGVDDFGNDLSSPAAKGKKNRYAFGKATTPEVWTAAAKFFHSIGFNASPEEARYVVQNLLGELPAGLMNDASKDLKEDETRLGQIAYGLSGGKRIWRKARTPGQDSYIRAINLQDRYEDLVKYIDHAHEVGDENGKLKYGTRDSNLYTWLNKVRATRSYSEREMEIMQYLAEFKRQQKRIDGKKLTKERKDELHYENNKRLVEMLRAYNKGDK